MLSIKTSCRLRDKVMTAVYFINKPNSADSAKFHASFLTCLTLVLKLGG